MIIGEYRTQVINFETILLPIPPIHVGIQANNPSKWGDGSDVGYTNWCSTPNQQPDESGGSLTLMWGEEHYNDGYCWGDWGGDDSFTYICEQPKRKVE